MSLKSILRSVSHVIPDKLYIKLAYYRRFHHFPDLKNPKKFSEKLQWLKLYNRKPIYTTMVDKYAAKKYVADIIGEEYIIPTLGVWDKFEDIDFDALPDQFVLKCTHDSGGLVICKDKAKFDKEEARKKINNCLKTNFYYHSREWPYKDVPKKIIAEKYIEDSTGALVDYKFYCFNGKADSVMLCIDRHIGDPKFYFFDKNWELKRYNKRGVAAPEGFTVRKPECIDKMFALAEQLSVGHPHLRVDFYEVDGKIYFGELTFFTSSGLDNNIVEDAQIYLGSLVDLSIVKRENS